MNDIKSLRQNKPGLKYCPFRRIEGCGKHILGRSPFPCKFELRVADLARVRIIELDFARPGLSPPKMFELWQSTHRQGANYQGDAVFPGPSRNLDLTCFKVGIWAVANQDRLIDVNISLSFGPIHSKVHERLDIFAF
jgi:hypothetical protein